MSFAATDTGSSSEAETRSGKTTATALVVERGKLENQAKHRAASVVMTIAKRIIITLQAVIFFERKQKKQVKKNERCDLCNNKNDEHNY